MSDSTDFTIPTWVPLRRDDSGAIRIGQTRVLLELVVHAFQDGATPEAIVQRYSTLQLQDVYAVIAYYLGHKTDIEEYLKLRESQAEAIRDQVTKTQSDLSDIRDRLLVHRQS